MIVNLWVQCAFKSKVIFSTTWGNGREGQSIWWIPWFCSGMPGFTRQKRLILIAIWISRIMSRGAERKKNPIVPWIFLSLFVCKHSSQWLQIILLCWVKIPKLSKVKKKTEIPSRYPVKYNWFLVCLNVFSSIDFKFLCFLIPFN